MQALARRHTRSDYRSYIRRDLLTNFRISDERLFLGLTVTLSDRVGRLATFTTYSLLRGTTCEESGLRFEVVFIGGREQACLCNVTRFRDRFNHSTFVVVKGSDRGLALSYTYRFLLDDPHRLGIRAFLWLSYFRVVRG